VARIGILALQGDVAAHGAAARALGHTDVPVKTAPPLDDVDALLLPGGESGTMLKLLLEEQLFEPVRRFCRSGRPVLGTCAGAILLADKVIGPSQRSLGVIDIDIERNAYGRQQDSFITQLNETPDGWEGLEAMFIRAPVIRRTGPEVEVLLKHDGHPVLVRTGPLWAATFHPEMVGDSRVLAAVLNGLGT
jgi:5'-phosphate synthase pdxT subunit